MSGLEKIFSSFSEKNNKTEWHVPSINFELNGSVAQKWFLLLDSRDRI